jgi:uncharacterized membrane protein YciS (DUF1049 family)
LQTTFATNGWKFKLNIFNNIYKLIIGVVALALIVLAVTLMATNVNPGCKAIFNTSAIGEYFLTFLYAWLVATGLITLYSLIRLN